MSGSPPKLGRLTATQRGRYSLGFDSPGTYDITASRPDLNTQTKWVDVVTQVGPVDFQPTYRLIGGLTPSAFNNDPSQDA